MLTILLYSTTVTKKCLTIYLSCSMNYTANQETERPFYIWSVVVRYKNVIETIYKRVPRKFQFATQNVIF